MATPYDVNAAMRPTNVLGMYQQGLAFGNQQRAVREQREQQNKLRELAPMVIAGDPNAYSQAVALDPATAGQYESAGQNQGAKLRGFVNYLDPMIAQAKQTGDYTRVNAAMREGAGLIQAVTGKPAPTEWQPGVMDAGWEQLKAKVAMQGAPEAGNEPAGYRQAHLTALAAGYQLGSPEYQRAMQVAAGTAPRSIPAGYTTRTYRDANGQEVVELVQTRGDNLNPGAQAPQAATAPPQQVSQPAASLANSGGDPQMDALTQAANAMIKAGVPSEQVDAFLMQAAQASPQIQVNPPQQAPMPSQQPPMPLPANAVGGGPIAPLPGSGRGQTDADRARAAAEQAAMVEEAKARAQLSLAPEIAAADANREAMITSARADATNQAAREATQATNNVAFSQYTAARDTLLADLNRTTTGPLSGRLPAMTENQQIAEGAQARMAPILKGLFRTAGEGTFTDKDQQLLMAMVPTRTDLPAAVKAKIAGIDAIVEAKLQQQSQQTAPPAAASGWSVEVVEE